VLGIAVLGAVFSSNGGYASGSDYVSGMTPAVYVGAVVVGLGVVAALIIPGRRRQRAEAALAEPIVEWDGAVDPGVLSGPGGPSEQARVSA
jgi:hypothetical protein